MTPDCRDHMASVCQTINALCRLVAAEFPGPAGDRAIDYLAECKGLIEHTYDLLRRETRWTKKDIVRWTQAQNRVLN